MDKWETSAADLLSNLDVYAEAEGNPARITI